MHLFLERGEGREKERERNINVREKHQLVASCIHLVRDWTRTPGMCSDWNRTGELLLCEMTPNQLSQTGQGFAILLSIYQFSAE